MFQAALEHEYAPLRCTFIIKSQSSSVILINDLSLIIPALLINTSILPKASKAYLIICSPFSTEIVEGMHLI